MKNSGKEDFSYNLHKKAIESTQKVVEGYLIGCFMTTRRGASFALPSSSLWFHQVTGHKVTTMSGNVLLGGFPLLAFHHLSQGALVVSPLFL
jgi:hypothetical protein